MTQNSEKRNGKVYNFQDLLSTTDRKGYFVECCIYDLFEASDYMVEFVGTEIEDKEILSQRMSEDYGIIVPDILCQKKYKEILFIESKSLWLDMDRKYVQNISGREIKRKTYDSYLRFQDESFKKSENIAVSAQIMLCFSTMRYSFSKHFGELDCSFIRLSDFRQLPCRISRNDRNEQIYNWRETDILENLYKSKKIKFSYDDWSEKFSSSYCSDVYGKNRNNFKVTAKSMKKLMNEWLWCA